MNSTMTYSNNQVENLSVISTACSKNDDDLSKKSFLYGMKDVLAPRQFPSPR